jgi:2,3-bisphosphoglycerate-independent phosphoglycerate mutase
MLVLDGAADRPEEGPTPLELASTPGLDRLAEHAVCFSAYPVKKGIAPESDEAVIALLGYEVDKVYTGRGPLEALGANMEFNEGSEVAFRANFATVDERTYQIIDRRVGRSLSSEEAKELARAVDGILLNGGRAYARVKATIGHRAVVVIGARGKRLSDRVGNTDPAYVRVGLHSVAVKEYERRIRECEPMDTSDEARYTCMLVNEFTKRVIEILTHHPVNVERARRGLPKANAILLRDAGARLPKMKPFTLLHGVSSAAALVEMPVEKGIARAASMKTYDVPIGRSAETYGEWVRRTLEALEANQFVYVHLKGPDEPGHDGSAEAKREAIELIDRAYLQPLLEKLDLNETAILVTSDHATPWSLRSHSDDPVPVMVSWKGLRASVDVFSERTCRNLILDFGWQVLPHAFRVIGWR